MLRLPLRDDYARHVPVLARPLEPYRDQSLTGEVSANSREGAVVRRSNAIHEAPVHKITREHLGKSWDSITRLAGKPTLCDPTAT